MPAEDPATRGASERIARLSEADAEAIDQLFEHGLEESNPDGPREQAALDLFAVLESYPTEQASDELVNATLARVNREETERASRFSIANAPGFNGRQIRLPDFFAVAAALFLAFGIGWPLYQVINRQNDIHHSQARLGEYGAGIVSFAGENNGNLPLNTESILESGHSMNDLPCALHGNYGTQLLDALTGSSQDPQNRDITSKFENAERSRLQKIGPVSYRVPMNARTFKLKAYDSQEPLLADPNPVIWSIRKNQPALSPQQGSHVHKNPLVVVVRFDLSFESLPSAVLPDGDSLWVHDAYDASDSSSTGPIRPQNLQDAVLAH